MFSKEIVVDAKGHLLGRMASTVAKELINGQAITLVRCEDTNISGSLYRNQLKYGAFKQKLSSYNPKKGPFHQRAPHKIVMRCIRGMVPYKTAKGAAAMDRLKCFDGIPYPFNMKKRMVIPNALKNIRLKPHRKFCAVKDVSIHFGWHQADLIERLESQRKVKSKKYYLAKKAKKLKELQTVKKHAKSLDTATLKAFGGIHPTFLA